jgi:hypothetical protein
MNIGSPKEIAVGLALILMCSFWLITPLVSSRFRAWVDRLDYKPDDFFKCEQCGEFKVRSQAPWLWHWNGKHLNPWREVLCRDCWIHHLWR